MAKINKPDQTTVGEAPQADPKPKRTALLYGIPRDVIRSYYKADEDCVVDVLALPKTVQDRKGHDVDIVLQRHVFCKDEAIQAKYRRGNDTEVLD